MSIERDFKDLSNLLPGWDSYSAPVPSVRAISKARAIVKALDVPPLQVLPSAEGGVGIILEDTESSYSDIEVFNDGEVIECHSDRKGNIEITERVV